MPISLIPSAKLNVIRPPERKKRQIAAAEVEPYDWAECVNPGLRQRWTTGVERVAKFKNRENVYRFVTESGRTIDLPYNAHLLGLIEGKEPPPGPHCVVDFLFDASAHSRSSFGKESSRRRHALIFENIPEAWKEDMRIVLKLPKGKYPAGIVPGTTKFLKVFYAIEEAVECYGRVLEKFPEWETLLGGMAWMLDRSAPFKRIFSAARFSYSFEKNKKTSVVVRDGGSLRLESIKEIEWLEYDGSVLEFEVACFNNAVVNGFVVFDVPKVWDEEA